MKLRPVGGEFFYVDERTGRYDEANSSFRNFANWPKKRTNLFFDFISRPLFCIYSHTCIFKSRSK
jgi:hypothetical protein